MFFLLLLSDFKKEILEAHNAYRKQHHAPPLNWSDEAAAAAQTWVDKLAKENVLKHGNHHEGMAQNLAMKYAIGGCNLSGQEVTEIWYSEESNYNYGDSKFGYDTGHFTQVVWKSTTHIGAAKAIAGNSCFVVANYMPPGNVVGHFEQNVLRK